MSEFQVGDVVRHQWMAFRSVGECVVVRQGRPDADGDATVHVRRIKGGGEHHFTCDFLTLVRRAEPERRASSIPACPHCDGTGLVEVWQYDTRCDCAETEQKTDFPANTLRILRSPSLGLMKVGP